jgi:hypothetical protein
MKLEVSETLTVETFWVQAPDGNRPAIRIAREDEAPVVVELDEVHGLVAALTEGATRLVAEMSGQAY